MLVVVGMAKKEMDEKIMIAMSTEQMLDLLELRASDATNAAREMYLEAFQKSLISLIPGLDPSDIEIVFSRIWDAGRVAGAMQHRESVGTIMSVDLGSAISRDIVNQIIGSISGDCDCSECKADIAPENVN